MFRAVPTVVASGVGLVGDVANVEDAPARGCGDAAGEYGEVAAEGTTSPTVTRKTYIDANDMDDDEVEALADSLSEAHISAPAGGGIMADIDAAAGGEDVNDDNIETKNEEEKGGWEEEMDGSAGGNSGIDNTSVERVLELDHDVPTIPEGEEEEEVSGDVIDDDMPFPDDKSDDNDDDEFNAEHEEAANIQEVQEEDANLSRDRAVAQPAAHNVLAAVPNESDLKASSHRRQHATTPRAPKESGLPFGEVRVGEAPIFSPLSFHGGTTVASSSSTSTSTSSSESGACFAKQSSKKKEKKNASAAASGVGRVRTARAAASSKRGRASLGAASSRRLSVTVQKNSDGIGILGMLSATPSREPVREQKGGIDDVEGEGDSTEEQTNRSSHSKRETPEGSSSSAAHEKGDEAFMKGDMTPTTMEPKEDSICSKSPAELGKDNANSSLDEESSSSDDADGGKSTKDSRSGLEKESVDAANAFSHPGESKDEESKDEMDKNDDSSEDSEDESESTSDEDTVSDASSSSDDVSIVLPNRRNKGGRKRINASDEDEESDPSFKDGSSSASEHENEADDILIYDQEKDDDSYTISSAEDEDDDDDVLIYESDESSIKPRRKKRVGRKTKGRKEKPAAKSANVDQVDSDEEQREDTSVDDLEQSVAAASIASAGDDDSIVEAEVIDDVIDESRGTDSDDDSVDDVVMALEDTPEPKSKTKGRTRGGRTAAAFAQSNSEVSLSSKSESESSIKPPPLRSVSAPVMVSTLSTSTSNDSSRSLDARRNSVKRGKWSLGAQIGVGSFGVVHMGMNHRTGQMMAVKSMNLPETDENGLLTDLEREIYLLRTLDHANIVRYIGCERDSSKNTLHIFQEWVPGGSVSSLLRKFGPFPLPVVRKYLHQIVAGLAYLHSNGIIHRSVFRLLMSLIMFPLLNSHPFSLFSCLNHSLTVIFLNKYHCRDIKGGNILVNDDGICKLADFGASRRIRSSGSSFGDNTTTNSTEDNDEDNMMQSLTMRGTPYFMAPEVFEEKYGPKADVWSVGGVAFQMYTGQPPWRSMGIKNPVSLLMHIKGVDGPPDFPPTLPKGGGNENDDEATASLKDLISSCFKRDPSRRLSAQTMLSHPFFYEDDCSTAISGDTSFGARSPKTPGSTRTKKSEPQGDGCADDNKPSNVWPEKFDMEKWPTWAKEKAASSPTFQARLLEKQGGKSKMSTQKNPFGRRENR